MPFPLLGNRPTINNAARQPNSRSFRFTAQCHDTTDVRKYCPGASGRLTEKTRASCDGAAAPATGPFANGTASEARILRSSRRVNGMRWLDDCGSSAG